jgi:hypothetical protein
MTLHVGSVYEVRGTKTIQVEFPERVTVEFDALIKDS